MAAGAPRQPDDDNMGRRQRARLAAWCQIMGVAVAIATLTFSVLGVISGQQAVALGLAAVVLIIGGLIVAAVLYPSSGGPPGFRTGLRVGTILRKWRSPLRRW